MTALEDATTAVNNAAQALIATTQSLVTAVQNEAAQITALTQQLANATTQADVDNAVAQLKSISDNLNTAAANAQAAIPKP